MVNVELDFWSWIARVTEKLTFIRLKALDHKDVTEDDYDLLKVLFRPYSNGEYPLYVTKFTKSEEKSVQMGLFAKNVTPTTDGIEIAYTISEPKTEKKDVTKKI